MTLRFFNTLGRRVEEFKPIEQGRVRIYTCGPTVYDYGHVGNFRTFVVQDVLRRYLKYKGFKVTQVMNLTDVDDKTIRGARRERVSLKEYTERYTRVFFEDLDTLSIERVERYPKATEHIGDMVMIVKRLLEKGCAYEKGGSVYYDVSKFKDYGRLSGVKPVESGERRPRVKADEYKEEASDFALWKSWDADDGDVFWETDLGKGRPGWHIECSAMSSRYLGETFDIHSGGVDLIFPHHENEIAQSEGAFNRKFVNYWLHSEHLIVEGRKMSKSLGNILTVRDILKKGYSGRTIRYLLLSAHYRAQLNFTEAGLKQAEASLQRLNDFLHRLRAVEGGEDSPRIREKCLEVQKRFEEAMDNDLGVPEALALVFDFSRDVNKLIDTEGASKENLEEVYDTMLKLDRVLGVLETGEERIMSEEVMRLIQLREETRRRRDWKEADKIRAELVEKGVVLEDTSEGVKWRLRRRPSGG